MKIALYLRYSSDKQTEQSIEGQRRVCEEYCRREGHEIVKEYIDRAASAYKNAEKRVAFQRMLREAGNGAWDAVLVYKLDRFARNVEESVLNKATLRRAGVKLLSATESIPDAPEGIVLASLLDGWSEYYSKELSQKINRGIRESVLKGNSTGGRIPLGYKIVNKRYTVVESEAQIVREAFELYAANWSIKEIIGIFNDKGYRTSYGKPFTNSSLEVILSNKKYIGVYQIKDVVNTEAIPPIIDKDLFDRVQERRTEFRHTRSAGGHAKAKEKYLLSGKLFCGHCGARMVGDSTVKPKDTYRYYSCEARKKKTSDCKKRRVGKDWIEALVAREAVKLLTPEMIDYLADAAVKAYREELGSQDLIDDLKSQISEYNKRIKNLLSAIETGAGGLAILAGRLEEVQKQKADAERRLTEAAKSTDGFTKDMVVFFLSQFSGGNVDDEFFRRQLIEILVKKVTIYDVPDDEAFDVTIEFSTSDLPIATEAQTVRMQEGKLHQNARIRTLGFTGFSITVRIRLAG